MLWCFALIALLSAAYVIATAPGVIKLDRPFTWLWVFPQVVSAAGGFDYHSVHLRTTKTNAVIPT
jgi:hypothetical protein